MEQLLRLCPRVEDDGFPAPPKHKVGGLNDN